MTSSKQPRSDRKRKAPVGKSPDAASAEGRNQQPGAGKILPGADQASGRHREPAEAPAVGARISRRAADRLRAGHVWVYASDVESLELGEAGPGEAPRLLPVADYRGVLLGTALFSPSSQIALRLISRRAVSESEWLSLLGERLKEAITRRRFELPSEAADNDSFRVCFSEADGIPGLMIDKYADLAIVQLLVKGLDSAPVREKIVATLREHLSPASILERPDPRIRELEGLSAPSLEPLYASDEKHPLTQTKFRLNGLVFHYDANTGQKTGAFLDQRTNYKAAQDWSAVLSPGGRALDVCTYQGGFALHLARVSKSVTGIDASRASLEVAERNLAANRGQIGAEVDWVEGDAFQILRDWAEAGEKFDTIVLDPPAFAKSKRAVEGALRGYKELNLRAIEMLKPRGLLVTCSCSHHVSPADFEGVVAAAAADARRRAILLDRRGAALDHPVVLNIPETEYLKCLVLEVE